MFSTSILYYEDYGKNDQDAHNLFWQSMAAFDGNTTTYHIALYDKPTIVWDFHSLLGIQMMFRFMVADDTKLLRLCRHCTRFSWQAAPAISFAARSVRIGITSTRAGRRKVVREGEAENEEVKKPKSWLKSISTFANGIGGTLFFGIDNDRNIVGLTDAQTDAEAISYLIKERITPFPTSSGRGRGKYNFVEPKG